MKARGAKRAKVYWLIFTADNCYLLSAMEVDKNAAPPPMDGETGRMKVSPAMARRWKRMMRKERGGHAK